MSSEQSSYFLLDERLDLKIAGEAQLSGSIFKFLKTTDFPTTTA